MEFTKEEISLCKQVAERHRKEVEYGDWFIMPADPHLFPTILEASPAHKLWKSEINKKAIPLWTMSDCLEFLQEKTDEVDVIELWRTGKKLKWFCRLENHKWKAGKTPLEACLKAVLAVLEEEK